VSLGENFRKLCGDFSEGEGAGFWQDFLSTEIDDKAKEIEEDTGQEETQLGDIIEKQETIIEQPKIEKPTEKEQTFSQSISHYTIGLGIGSDKTKATDGTSEYSGKPAIIRTVLTASLKPASLNLTPWEIGLNLGFHSYKTGLTEISPDGSRTKKDENHFKYNASVMARHVLFTESASNNVAIGLGLLLTKVPMLSIYNDVNGQSKLKSTTAASIIFSVIYLLPVGSDDRLWLRAAMSPFALNIKRIFSYMFHARYDYAVVSRWFANLFFSYESLESQDKQNCLNIQGCNSTTATNSTTFVIGCGVTMDY